MDKKQNDVKVNKRLLNANMAEKFRISFQSVNIGMAVVAVIAIVNIFLIAKAGGISVFGGCCFI